MDNIIVDCFFDSQCIYIQILHNLSIFNARIHHQTQMIKLLRKENLPLPITLVWSGMEIQAFEHLAALIFSPFLLQRGRTTRRRSCQVHTRPLCVCNCDGKTTTHTCMNNTMVETICMPLCSKLAIAYLCSSFTKWQYRPKITGFSITVLTRVPIKFVFISFESKQYWTRI